VPEISFLEAIAAAGKMSVRFACALRGWPQARIALWEELDRLRGDPRPETRLRFMNRHRKALGKDWGHRRGYASCLPVIRPTANGSSRWVQARRPRGKSCYSRPGMPNAGKTSGMSRNTGSSMPAS